MNNKSQNGMLPRDQLCREGSVANTPKGTRSSFQTDTSISAGRTAGTRELQRWDAPSGDSSSNGLVDGGLEDSTDSNKPWDQFATNEKKFGVQTDYDEDIYTTAIDRTKSDYKDKVAWADQQARKITETIPVSAHTAEERVMDHTGGPGDGRDEEDK